MPSMDPSDAPVVDVAQNPVMAVEDGSDELLAISPGTKEIPQRVRGERTSLAI